MPAFPFRFLDVADRLPRRRLTHDICFIFLQCIHAACGLIMVAVLPQIYYYDSFCDILDGLEDYIIADLVAVMARVRACVVIRGHPVLAWKQIEGQMVSRLSHSTSLPLLHACAFHGALPPGMCCTRGV